MSVDGQFQDYKESQKKTLKGIQRIFKNQLPDRL